MSNIIILGGGGQLAIALQRKLSALQSHSTLSFSITEVDITNPDSVIQVTEKYRPEYLINCAAYTDVDGAETNRNSAFRVNEDGVRNIVASIKRASQNTKLIHFSTDYVFNGENPPEDGYSENDRCAPINIYGKSKRGGEMVLLEEFPEIESLIIRPSWLYGEGESNFVRRILAKAAKEEKLQVVCDLKGSPTSTLRVADLVVALLEKNLFGSFSEKILHFSGTGRTSWYEFANEIKRLCGLTNQIDPVGSGEFKTAAKRPRDTYLSKRRVESMIPEILESWQKSLKTFIDYQKMSQRSQ